MIIRALRLRHGRLALPRTSTPISTQRRWQSSLDETTTSERVEAPSFVDSNVSVAQQQLDSIPHIRSVALNDPDHPVAQDYAFFQHQKARTQHLGSSIAPHYKPHELLTNPPAPKDITLELLLASQAHIGHSTSLWHPANARYIFGVRGRKTVGESPIHIISLEATAAHLRRACKVVSGVTEKGGLVLFVGTRNGQARTVVKAAQMAKGCHLFTKWIPGSITNGQQILGRCGKKVVNHLDEEVEGFEDQLGVKAALKPDLVICLNPLENYILLHECGLNNIPTIGIVDTDCNPTWVTYPIPANDDSLRSVQVIAGALGRAGEQGQEARLQAARRGVVTYNQAHGLTSPNMDALKRSHQQPKQRERPQRTQPASTPVTQITEPDLPEDLEGVDVKQHEADQALLSEAEEVLLNQGLPAEETENAAQLNSLDQQWSVTDEEAASEDISKVDPSLTTEDYAAQEQHNDDEDLAQFGGLDQLSTSSKPSTTSPEILPDEAAHELKEDAEGESPIEQVEDVEKELGEELEPIGNPEVAGETTDYTKDVSKQSRPAVPVSEATTEGVDVEEGGKRKGQ